MGPPADEDPPDRDMGRSGERSETAEAEASSLTDIGPAEMGTLSPEEWAERFETGAWITGSRLLDRVERDLKARIATRDVFAVLERPAEDRLLAYSDEGYAIVFDDGSVEGHGTVFRDVKTSVVMAANEGYDVPEPPTEWSLPDPATIQVGGNELGNRMLQVLGAGLGFAGLAMLGAAVAGVAGRSPVLLVVIGLAFLGVGAFFFFVVANARLSSRFRAREYRDRLEGAGVGRNGRPPFVPDPLEEPPDGEGDTPHMEGARGDTAESR